MSSNHSPLINKLSKPLEKGTLSFFYTSGSKSTRMIGSLGMKMQQITSNSFPGRNRGIITVLIKKGGLCC